MMATGAGIPLITVFGAADTQGDSVLTRLYQTCQGVFALRGIVEPVVAEHPRIEKWRRLGIECRVVDHGDTLALREAVRGSYGVFLMEDYWRDPVKDHLILAGRMVCDACLATRVRHLVFSSAPHSSKLSEGAIRQLDPFDCRAEVQEYIEQRKSITGMIATYLLGGFHMCNVMCGIEADEHGDPIYLSALFSGEVTIPLYDVEADCGKFVEAVLRAGAVADGVSLQAVSEWISLDSMTSQVTLTDAVTGAPRSLKWLRISPALLRAFLPPVRAPMYLAVGQLASEFGFFGRNAIAKQPDSDRFLAGVKKSSWKEYLDRGGPWKWPGLPRWP